MQHHRHIDREQADASLARFYDALGHRMPATEAFRLPPRLSGRAVHEDLSPTINRLRRASAEARVVRPFPAPRRMVAISPRIARQRYVAARDRALRAATAVTLIGLAVWVGVPVAIAFAAGAL